MVVAEIFLPSEHHLRHHVAHRLVGAAVCYRDVPSAVCDLLVTQAGKDSCCISLPSFPRKFAEFALSIKARKMLMIVYKKLFCSF